MAVKKSAAGRRGKLHCLRQHLVFRLQTIMIVFNRCFFFFFKSRHGHRTARGQFVVQTWPCQCAHYTIAGRYFFLSCHGQSINTVS
jgi:hypothetical protein